MDILALILVCSLAADGHEHCLIHHVEITLAERTLPEAIALYCEIVETVYQKRNLIVTRCKDITLAKPEPEPKPVLKEVPVIEARHKMENLYHDYQKIGI